MRMVNLNPIIDSLWSDRLHGTSAADYVELTWGNDTIHGGGGNDAIWDLDGHYQNAYPGNPGDAIWLASDDLIYGGSGDDIVFAGLGADSLHGGSGRDTLDYRYSKSAVEVNLILGRGYGDERSAARGDVISGFEVLAGSAHDDLFFLGNEAVTVSTGRGNDSIYGGTGTGEVYSGQGDDLFVAGSGQVEFWGGEGHDTLSFILSTTGRSAALSADRSIETLRGSAHGDQLSAVVEYIDRVTLYGEGGNDALAVVNIGYGIGGAGTLFGGSGNDSLTGAANADSLYGGSGHDLAYGGRGDDLLDGGTGNDSLYGGDGRDILHGGDGNDLLSAGSGTGDRLYGGAGNDRLMAGNASATLFGGSGTDTFMFLANAAAAAGSQRISDFQRGLDKIDISGIDARPMPNGYDPALAGDQAFVFLGRAGKSAPAGSLDTRFVGNDTILRLHTDSDGIADYQIVLTGLHSLTADDFVL